MNKDIKKKNIILSIVVLLIGLFVVGGTYAWLTATMEVTDGNYAISSDCFLIDYNIDNDDGNSQNITGTLFPSANASKGLNGRVGLKINNSCNVYGTGTIKLHVDSSVDSKLTTGISSYCESKKTLEKIDGINTKEACDNANGNWMGYSDSYCENPNTLERIKEYTTQSDCESNSGSWISGGSPLKYAVYNINDTSQTPISVGHITSSDIGHDVVLKENIIVTDSQEYYYIYIWLDGNMTDNTFANISFSGTIIANAIQNNDAKNDSITLTFDYNGATGGNTLTSKTVVLGEPYGTLPTPTRTGYTFLGWNGKNLFNEEEILMAIEAATYENGYYKFLANKAWQLYGVSGNSLPITFNQNKQYTYSVRGFASSNSILYFGFRYYESSTDYLELNSDVESIKTLTSKEDFDVRNSFMTYGTSDLIFIKYIQLEEGKTATTYEPYYVTSSTIVTERNTDYVLTAIWQANS